MHKKTVLEITIAGWVVISMSIVYLLFRFFYSGFSVENLEMLLVNIITLIWITQNYFDYKKGKNPLMRYWQFIAYGIVLALYDLYIIYLIVKYPHVMQFINKIMALLIGFPAIFLLRAGLRQRRYIKTKDNDTTANTTDEA